MKRGLLFARRSRMLSRMLRCLPLFAVLALAGGCIHVSMDPIQVHAVVDVNVKVDKALDDFFGDLDQKSATIAEPAAETPPSANP
jgi:hypothetical protein